MLNLNRKRLDMVKLKHVKNMNTFIYMYHCAVFMVLHTTDLLHSFAFQDVNGSEKFVLTFQTKIKMVSRVRLHYCKIILATSLVWFLLDVFILMYFTDCAANSVNTNCKQDHQEGPKKQQDSGGFLEKLLPKGREREWERKVLKDRNEG